MSRFNRAPPLLPSGARGMMHRRMAGAPPPHVATIGDTYGGPLPPHVPIPPKLRAAVWFGAALLLLFSAIAIAALAISIHNLVVNARHARELGLRSDSGTKMLLPPGDVARTTDADRGTLEELRDVQLGSKARPLSDGDLLRWERGRIVNARDPMLTQELAHHVDAKIVRPATGDVLLYNETAGQWRNVPLRAFLTMSGLHDVHMPIRSAAPNLENGARLEYDAKRGHWSYRPPHARAWLSFCIPTEDGEASADKWGHLTTPLSAGKWVAMNPKSERLSIFAVDQYSNGGMRVSRKNANIMTPRPPRGGGRPSAALTPYRVRATVSTVGFPPGAWGFVVGGEARPSDNGFVVAGSADGMQSFTVETVRNVGYEQTISLAYNAQHAVKDPAGATWPEPLIQCMRMSVEEL